MSYGLFQLILYKYGYYFIILWYIGKYIIQLSSVIPVKYSTHHVLNNLGKTKPIYRCQWNFIIKLIYIKEFAVWFVNYNLSYITLQIQNEDRLNLFLAKTYPFFDIYILGMHKNIQIHLLFGLFLSLFIIFHHNKDRINLYIFILF